MVQLTCIHSTDRSSLTSRQKMFRMAAHKMLKSCSMLSALMVASIAWFSAGVAHATTFTYTGDAIYGPDSNGSCSAGLGGGDSADWFDARNWGAPCAPAGVPGPNDDAVIGDFTVIIAGDATVHNLTFS